MELTPIKIPGKYKRYCKDANLSRKSQLNKYGVKFSSNYSRLDKINSTKTKKRSLCLGSNRTISSLEKLPTELITRIFFHCINLELPRSSPILTACLSCKSVYIQTILAVFGPTWHRCCETNSDLIPTTKYCDFIEDAQLQSAILRCRWASLSILLEARKIWFKKHLTAPLVKYFNPCKKFDVKDIDTSHFNPKEYLEHDFKGFIEITSLRDQIPNKHELCWETGCEVAKGVEIPKSLLSGPWSDEDIKHLFWTIKSGAELNWLNSIAGEMAVDGMKYAISIGNIHIIYLLLWRGLWKSGIECMFHQIIDGHKMLVWALRNVGGDALAVMTHLLSLARDIISSEEKDEILAELSYIQSEAIRTNDLAKTSWILLLQPVAKEIMKPLT